MGAWWVVSIPARPAAPFHHRARLIDDGNGVSMVRASPGRNLTCEFLLFSSGSVRTARLLSLESVSERFFASIGLHLVLLRSRQFTNDDTLADRKLSVFQRTPQRGPES
jgi:hypothetical protein